MNLSGGIAEADLIDPRPFLGECAGDLYYPPYRAISRGPWSVRFIAMAASRGYWGQVYKMDGTVVLTGPSDQGSQSWMSLVPSEMESQEIGLRAAYGHTVVFGMGMGWLVANLAMRPQVDRVTVVERDTNILSIIEASGVLSSLPAEAFAKIVIVQADALEWKPDCPVDTLQADIWLRFVEPQKLSDVRRMQQNVKAKSVYFWGQEMEIWRFACRLSSGAPALDWPMLRHIVEVDIDLPLILPDWIDYPEKIAGAAVWWTPKGEWWRA